MGSRPRGAERGGERCIECVCMCIYPELTDGGREKRVTVHVGRERSSSFAPLSRMNGMNGPSSASLHAGFELWRELYECTCG